MEPLEMASSSSWFFFPPRDSSYNFGTVDNKAAAGATRPRRSSDPKAPGPPGPQGHNSQLCVHRIVNFDSRAGGNKSCALCYRLSQRRRIDKLLLLMTGVINSAGVESLLGAINKEHH